ncbi:MAG: enoyl-CoA hydratase-related protein [Pseudomonadota bacterium]
MAEPLSIETDARGVATLRLARPERHNALNAELITALTEAAQRVGADPAVRVVVLTGAGESFCAGGDLEWFRHSVSQDRAGRMDESRRLADLFAALNSVPKPVIGRINGQAFGGGVGLISVCDLAIGLAAAPFALTEVRLGLAPANISPYVVAKIGAGAARAVMLSGAAFTGARAREIGLLTETAADLEDLDAQVEAAVAAHLEASSEAVAATKALIAAVDGEPPNSMGDYTAGVLADVWDSADGRTGIECFLEKRRPPWRSKR